MALVALLFLIVGMPFAAFNSGGTVPSSGTGNPARVTTSSGRAVLGLKSVRPVVVAGHGFQPGESVRISGIGTKRVRASTAGTFSVSLGGAVERCSGFSLFAVGSRGSRASLDFSRLLCPMQ